MEQGEAARRRQAQPDARPSPRATKQGMQPAQHHHSQHTSSTTGTQDPTYDERTSSDHYAAAPTSHSKRAEPPAVTSLSPSAGHWHPRSHHEPSYETRAEQSSGQHFSQHTTFDLKQPVDWESGRAKHGDSIWHADATAESNTTSLPSFALLKEFTEARTPGKPHTTDFGAHSRAERPAGDAATCYCDRLAAMIETAASAVHRLHATLQRHFSRLNPESITLHVDGPVHTLQSLIDRLATVESELSRADSTAPHRSFCASCSTTLSAGDKSPAYLKRPAEQESHGTSKRSRMEAHESRSSPPMPYLTGRPPSRSRRTERSHRPSSPPTLRPLELAQPASQPGAQSHRLLPSPSSLVHAAAPLTASSRISTSASPTTVSYQPTTNLHNPSTSSVTSQHMADLEHKVSLISLSLQTLRDEHTHLLQKWHRERTKTQTIEKKCQIADTEINELSNRNEELQEQVKTMDSQLRDLETKRDGESRSAARDKEQWSRMLEMSNRLQSEVEKKCQRLQTENARLEESLRAQNGGKAALDTDLGLPSTTLGVSSASDQAPDSSDVLKARAETLQGEVDGLRSALQDAQDRSSNIEEKLRELGTQRQDLSRILDGALAGRNEDRLAEVPGQPSHTQPNTSLAHHDNNDR